MTHIKQVVIAKMLNIILDIMNDEPDGNYFDLQAEIENWLEDYYKKTNENTKS